MTKPRAPHRGVTEFSSPSRSPWPMALVLAAGCNLADSEPTRSPRAHEEDPRVVYERVMAHEHHSLDAHSVQLLDGLVQGRVAARRTPTVECSTLGKGMGCTMHIDLGSDENDQPHRITCLVSDEFEPFGPIVKAFQGPTWLIEPPSLSVEERGEGIEASFVANNAFEDDSSSMMGTLKISTLYSEGYMATCVDMNPGGRETFTRVVSGFFDSLSFGARPHDPAVFSMAYRIREGDRTVGFRYGFVSTDGKQTPRFTEHSTSFRLDVDEQEWTIFDGASEVVRKADSTIESYRSARWWDGEGPHVLSVKPAEDGRLRVKAEMGQRIDALELTPRAALDTELWAAARLRSVATEQTEQYVYAWPAMDDGDPSLSYVLLSPGGAGVVVERIRSHRRFDETPDPADDVRDELHVDERGLVTKEVTTGSIDELLFAHGEIPPLPAETATVVASAPPPPKTPPQKSPTLQKPAATDGGTR